MAPILDGTADLGRWQTQPAPLLIRIGEWAQNKTVRPGFLFAASFALVLAMAGAL